MWRDDLGRSVAVERDARACYPPSSSYNAFASCKSAVSKPSVNHPYPPLFLCLLRGHSGPIIAQKTHAENHRQVPGPVETFLAERHRHFLSECSRWSTMP